MLNNLATTTEHRPKRKIQVRLEKSPLDALGMLQKLYKEQTLSHSIVFLWHKRFKKGREDVEDDHRSGKPSIMRNETNSELIKKMGHGDCRLIV